MLNFSFVDRPEWLCWKGLCLGAQSFPTQVLSCSCAWPYAGASPVHKECCRQRYGPLFRSGARGRIIRDP